MKILGDYGDDGNATVYYAWLYLTL